MRGVYHKAEKFYHFLYISSQDNVKINEETIIFRINFATKTRFPDKFYKEVD